MVNWQLGCKEFLEIHHNVIILYYEKKKRLIVQVYSVFKTKYNILVECQRKYSKFV